MLGLQVNPNKSTQERPVIVDHEEIFVIDRVKQISIHLVLTTYHIDKS